MDPSSIPPPPKLQTAQVLADLNALKQAPPQAALSLLRTLSTMSTTGHERKTSIHSQAPPKFDRLGRRISNPPKSSPGSQSSSASPSPPPMLRTHSSMASIDLPETEESKKMRREIRNLKRVNSGEDEDFKRAKTLLVYFRNRNNLRERGTRGLNILQERVDKALNERAEGRLKEEKKNQIFSRRPGESSAGGSYF